MPKLTKELEEMIRTGDRINLWSFLDEIKPRLVKEKSILTDVKFIGTASEPVYKMTFEIYNLGIYRGKYVKEVCFNVEMTKIVSQTEGQFLQN